MTSPAARAPGFLVPYLAPAAYDAPAARRGGPGGVTAAYQTWQRACSSRPLAKLSRAQYFDGGAPRSAPRSSRAPVRRRRRNARNGSERPREFGSAESRNGRVTGFTSLREFDRRSSAVPDLRECGDSACVLQRPAGQEEISKRDAPRRIRASGRAWSFTQEDDDEDDEEDDGSSLSRFIG